MILEGDTAFSLSSGPVCIPQGEGSTMKRMLCAGTVLLILIAALLFAVLTAGPAAGPVSDGFSPEEVNRGTSLLEVSTLDPDWHLGR